jgi:hypothetical protein
MNNTGRLLAVPLSIYREGQDCEAGRRELDLTAKSLRPQRIPRDFAVKCIKIAISLRFYPESPIFAALFT